MPFIRTTTTVKISPQQEKQLKEKLGQAIALIPGKNESWLMLAFDPDTAMYFRGDNSVPCAFVDIRIFGKASPEYYEHMTARVCDIFREVLGIAPDRCYVTYQEINHWGWNSQNF